MKVVTMERERIVVVKKETVGGVPGVPVISVPPKRETINGNPMVQLLC